jgi:hypothetical protein
LRAANAPGLIAASAADYIDLATNTQRRHEAAESMEPAAIFDDNAVPRALNEFLLNQI